MTSKPTRGINISMVGNTIDRCFAVLHLNPDVPTNVHMDGNQITNVRHVVLIPMEQRVREAIEAMPKGPDQNRFRAMFDNALAGTVAGVTVELIAQKLGLK